MALTAEMGNANYGSTEVRTYTQFDYSIPTSFRGSCQGYEMGQMRSGGFSLTFGDYAKAGLFGDRGDNGFFSNSCKFGTKK